MEQKHATGQDDEPPAPVIAVAGVIVAMALVAVGNGLMFGYIPVSLGAAGYAPTWAGTILTGLSAGGLAGCLLTGALVRRVGHARAYMVFSALVVLSNVAIGAGTFPVVWIAARVLYGFAICGLFIVAQSWLNDAVGNEIRGRVMAIFYVSYVVGLGVGSFLLGFVDIATAQAPLIGIAFNAVSILPVGLTRLRQPPPPKAASVALARAWRISPVGVAGMLAVGGVSMLAPASRRSTPRPAASASNRWRRCCLPCRSARCCSRSRSAGFPTVPIGATCSLPPAFWW